MYFISSWPGGLVAYVTTWDIFSCSLLCPWDRRCGRHADALRLVDDREQYFFHMHGDNHRWSLATTRQCQDCQNKRGLPDHFWVLQRALEGRSGRTERSKAARGRIMHQRPEHRGAVNKPIVQYVWSVLKCTHGACNFTCFGRVTPCTPQSDGA